QGPAGGVFGSFTTRTVPATNPTLVATWPQDHATNQSGTSELVVVFDRPMQASTLDTDSFAVTVNGNPPAFDPAPRPVDLGGGPDNRVFTWQSLDARGDPADLGQDSDVTVTLSPLGHQIKDAGGATLDAQNFGFTTAPFSAPVSAAITSVP